MSYLDTRDLAARKEELEKELQGLEDSLEEKEELLTGDDGEEDLIEEIENLRSELADWHEENDDELEELQNLENEIPEFADGETMIPESEWEEYVEELCKDCGYLPKDLPHWLVIDWEATAANVACDYTTVDYQGTTYYVRNV